MVFIQRAQPHTQSLFLFPIVFGVNLIHFFDEKKDSWKFDRLLWCFDPLSHHLTEAKRRKRTVSKSATFLETESVSSTPFKRGETKALPITQIFFVWITARTDILSRNELGQNPTPPNDAFSFFRKYR